MIVDFFGHIGSYRLLLKLLSMENESVSQEGLTCHTKWNALNRDRFRLKWSYKSRT